MKTKTIYLLIVVLLISSAVWAKSSKQKDEYSEKDFKIRFLDSNIIINFMETYESIYSSSTPKIIIKMETDKKYPNMYPIMGNLKIKGNSIYIKIKGIGIPKGGMFPAVETAKREMNLNIFEGSYNIIISSGKIEDKYRLKITSSSINMVSEKSTFTKLRYETFWRYPPNSFVYLCGTTTDTYWMCDDFLSKLKNEVKIEEFKFPDNGEVPYPIKSEGYHRSIPAKYFYYSKEEDFDKAGELLKAYNENTISKYQGVDIWLINWNNKRYLSWMFDVKR